MISFSDGILTFASRINEWGKRLNQDIIRNKQIKSNRLSNNHFIVQGFRVTIHFSEMRNEQLPFFIREMLCKAYNTIEQMEMMHKFHVVYQDRYIIRFTYDEYLIEFSFWPEDSPNFKIQIKVGLLEDNQIVALWFLLKTLQINVTCNSVSETEVELHNSLMDIGVNILTMYYTDIFNANNIRKAYSEMINDLHVKQEEEKINGLKDKVYIEFRNKNYKDLVKLVDANHDLCINIRILKMSEYSIKQKM